MELFKRLRPYGWVLGVLGAIVVMGIGIVVWRCGGSANERIVAKTVTVYDISFPEGQYEISEGVVENGEPMGVILDRFGVVPSLVHTIEQQARGIFDLRNVRAGQPYMALVEPVMDSLSRPRLVHFVYEKNREDYFVISLLKDSLDRDSLVVRNGKKPIRIERKHATATIESSLWNAIVGNGLPGELAVELEDIYGWSIDFFGIQHGDSFKIIYDQKYIDTLPAGVGRVWGAVFENDHKTYHAIPFKQDGKIAYWDENGNSMKKQFLKAPLKYSRISSGYSTARRHPITRKIRPHLAVDYAAPSGTPVSAVADGTVSRKFWDRGGGGNTLFIKHARGYETGYLHLRGYAKGIAVGTRVRQGQVIGYVGSTGASTGPHLDYRVKVNGKSINPLKIPQEPGEPVKSANKASFDEVKRRVMGELNGSLPASEWVTQLDSLP